MNDDLESMTTSELFSRFMVAAERGEFGKVLATVDEMCRKERAGTCPDLLPAINTFSAFKSYSKEVLQGTQDRIDQYNSYVK